MKKIFMLLSAAALISACNDSNENGYKLSGTIDPFYNGSNVMLIKDDSRDTTVVENGAFTFEGECESPFMATVFAVNGNQYVQANVIIENGNPKIFIDADGHSQTSGTPLNIVFNEANLKVEDLEVAFNVEYSKISEMENLESDVKAFKLDSLYNEFSMENFKVMSEVFNTNKDNVVGANAMLRLYSDKATFDSLYNVAGDAVKNNKYIVAEKNRFENIDKTSAGKMFIDFTIENGNADGTAVKFSDYVGKGKYVLVDFWASWCGPCKAEMPNLAEVYKKYKGDKFEIVGIAVWDKREDTERSLKSLPITWPVIYDAQKIPTDIYGINGIPQIILFGPDGTIIARDLRGADIGKKLSEIFGK